MGQEPTVKAGAGVAITMLCFLLINALIVPKAYSGPQSFATIFEDNFDGPSIDPEKWNTSIATSGNRWCSDTVELHHSNPGIWLDPASETCQGIFEGSPYGSVTVDNGKASFSAGPMRNFPYIWRGSPSMESPFPATGDFAVEVRMKFDQVGNGGTGFAVVPWVNSDPVGNNPPIPQGLQGMILLVWANGAGLYVRTVADPFIPLPGALDFHVYRLEFVEGYYSLFFDNSLVSGPAFSSIRPYTMWLGNPAITFWEIPERTDFSVDYVHVSVPVNSQGDLLFVSSWDGNIYGIDLVSGDVLTLYAGLVQPEDVAVNSKGQVFVTEVDAPRITRFEPDGSGRTVIQLPFCCPEGSSFDIFDNLYFNTNAPHSGIWRISGGDPNSSPVQVVPQFATRGEGTTFLPNGDILAVDIAGVVIKSSPPSFGSYSVFANTTQIIGIDADSSGRVCVTDREPVNAVECFDKNGTSLGVLATGFNVPRHSEFDSQGNFYVGNFLGNNVIKVSAQGQTSVVAQVFRAHGIGIFHRTTPQAFSDNFDDNSRDPSVWTSFNVGSGPVIAETNQRLEITFPQTSSDDGALHVFGAGYTSVCQLRGDFDIQADFQLFVWPFANGVRLGMGGPETTFLTATPTNSAIERVSFGDFSADAPGQSREVYLTHFNDGVQGITPTSDLSGKLRLVRAGSTLTGYYFSANNWIAIHSGPTVAKDFHVNLVAWSHDYAFTNQFVRIAFDNFIVSQGLRICPQGITVSIDIKPGSDPNSINVRSQGLVPVAILTTTDFDAVTVNASTVRFGHTGNEAPPINSALEDVDSDGDLDMTLRFNLQDTGFKAGDTQGTLTGRTFDGISISGTDSIRVFFPGDANGDLAVNVLDLAIVGSAFGSTSRSLTWNLQADFDDNGVINILDLAVVGTYFGQHA